VFRLLAPYFFGNSAKEVSKKTPPRHPIFYFKKQNKSPFFSPDFCGRCGTHESESRFAQTAAAESPTKIWPSSAWLMGKHQNQKIKRKFKIYSKES